MAPTMQRRFSEVYVELPSYSPRMSTGSARYKENHPLQPLQSPSKPQVARSASDDVLKEKAKDKDASDKKRKALDPAPSTTVSKKPKLSSDDGLFTCHQCTKKMAPSAALHCTRIVKGMRCKLKYCGNCLKNRYGEDHEAVRRTGRDPKVTPTDHVSDAREYLYSCPRCLGCCNCRMCRKAAGLQPTGKITIPNGESVRDLLVKNPTATAKTMKPSSPPKATSTRSEIVPHDVDEPVVLLKPVEHVTKEKSVTRRAPAPMMPPAVPPKAPKIPKEPEWTEIPTDMSREDVEDRIYLREFILRFGPLMSVAKTHIDALDHFDTLSDATVKALVVALLDLISVEEKGSHQKTFQRCVKDVRSAHSPSKIWTVLERLRDSGAIDLPDPVDGEGAYNTRHGATVAQGAQLLPILLVLCEKVLRGANVRGEIEERAREHPQFNRDALYGPLKEVNEAWTERRKALLEEKTKDGVDMHLWKTKYKDEEKKHREQVADIENTHYEHEAEYAPRFRTLGRDFAGRTYYLLSTPNVKKVPTDTEREEFARWAWFVAAYGKAGAEQEEGWWGFGTPKDVRALSKWLMALALNDAMPKERDDISPDSPLSVLSEDEDKIDSVEEQLERYYGPKPTLAEVKTLCKRLDEFSGWLEWRLAEEQN